MRHPAVLLLISLLLASCQSSRTPAPEPVEVPRVAELRTDGGYWYCKQFDKSPQDYIEHCYMEVMVDASKLETWDRIACFGQFTFTQLDQGKVRTFPKDFSAVVESRGHYFSQPFKIFAFVYFSEDHVALDPSLDWYQCKVLAIGDDRAVPEKPLRPY